jgi:hypothetical protein
VNSELAGRVEAVSDALAMLAAAALDTPSALNEVGTAAAIVTQDVTYLLRRMTGRVEETALNPVVVWRFEDTLSLQAGAAMSAAGLDYGLVMQRR